MNVCVLVFLYHEVFIFGIVGAHFCMHGIFKMILNIKAILIGLDWKR